MIYGVFSDVHSNIEALKVVLDYFKAMKVESYICCGDIVGYGPDPNECVSVVDNLPNLTIVAGNHDIASCGLKDISWFNKYAQQSILWTAGHLTEVNKLILSRYPKIVTGKSFTIVHGTLQSPVDEYMEDEQQMGESLGLFSTQLCFVGHTHIPFVFSKKGGEKKYNSLSGGDRIAILPEYKYIINIGSVGQPRDSDPRACCALYDDEKLSFEFVRLNYDVSKTQEKMKACLLPSFLVERLIKGK